MIKLIIVVSLVVTVIGTNSAVQPRGVFEDADAALEQYKVTVRQVLSRVSAIYQDTYDEIYQTGLAIVNIASRILSRAQAEYTDLVNEVERTLLDHGLDPSTCTYSAKLEIQRFSSSLKSDVDTCVNQMLYENANRLTSAFATFHELDRTVDEYVQRIETCRSTNDEICALIVIAQISLHNELLPIILEGDIQAIVDEYSRVDLQFQTCSRGPTAEVYVRGDIIVEVVTMCSENLINSKP